MTETFDLHLSRLVKAPRNLVWKAWITKELLEEWWCPKPWKAVFPKFDPRPGGAFNTIMRGPDGEENTYEGSFLEVVPEERIVFTGLMAENWRPLPDTFLGFVAIITMTDEDGGTRYSALVRHSSADAVKQHEEMGFEHGWGAAIQQLEDVARGLK